METFGSRVLKFQKNLNATFTMSDGVDVLRPYEDAQIVSYAELFYHKYYNDNRPRTFIISISPHKYGFGLTGVPLTDPVKLEVDCGIPNVLPKHTDPSSEFMYHVIKNYGGVDAFYSKFYITSLSPVGFTSHGGSTVNYYDKTHISNVITPLIGGWLRTQLTFGAVNERCICLGAYENLKYLNRLNKLHRFFKRIDVLEHPQYIMEQHSRMLPEFSSQYLDILKKE